VALSTIALHPSICRSEHVPYSSLECPGPFFLRRVLTLHASGLCVAPATVERPPCEYDDQAEALWVCRDLRLLTGVMAFVMDSQTGRHHFEAESAEALRNI
jgi:hypothetical protein